MNKKMTDLELYNGSKKNMMKVSKKRLVDLLVLSREFNQQIEKIVSQRAPDAALQELFEEAYKGEIPLEEFMGAVRFINKYEKEFVKRASELEDFEYYKPVKRYWNFSNWYKRIIVPKDQKDE